MCKLEFSSCIVKSLDIICYFEVVRLLRRGGVVGPLMWGSIASTCSGLKQSPINIDPTVSISLSSLSDFVFHDYDSNALNMTLKSNGHAGGCSQ